GALDLSADAARLRAEQAYAVDPWLRQPEQIPQAGDTEGYLRLLDASAVRNGAIEFASTELLPGATRAAVQQGDRQPLGGTKSGDGYRLMVQTFVEHGPRARLATWRIAAKRTGDTWHIVDQERLTSVENLYRLPPASTTQ